MLLSTRLPRQEDWTGLPFPSPGDLPNPGIEPASPTLDFPGKKTGVCCHFLLQGIFLTQGSNLCPPHWQVDSLLLSRKGSPAFWKTKPKNAKSMRKDIRLQKKRNSWEFPVGPEVRTWHFHYCGPGSSPTQGTKILQAMWHGQKKKKKERKEIFLMDFIISTY